MPIHTNTIVLKRKSQLDAAMAMPAPATMTRPTGVKSWLRRMKKGSRPSRRISANVMAPASSCDLPHVAPMADSHAAAAQASESSTTLRLQCNAGACSVCGDSMEGEEALMSSISAVGIMPKGFHWRADFDVAGVNDVRRTCSTSADFEFVFSIVPKVGAGGTAISGVTITDVLPPAATIPTPRSSIDRSCRTAP